MKNDAEEIVALATMFALNLTKGKSSKELCSYRTFFCTISNTINSVISEKSSKKN